MEFEPPEGYAGLDSGTVSHVLSQPPDESSDMDIGALPPPDGEPDGDEASAGDFEPVFELGADAEEKIAALGNAIGDRLRRSLEVRGVDALGYYVPFHARGVQWGAHVRLSGMIELLEGTLKPLQTDTLTKMRLAFHAILQHELFHFATEYAVAQAELTQQQAWWVAANHRLKAGTPPYHEREEKLANAWMLKAFKTQLPAYKVNGKQEVLKRFVRWQPAGYRDALEVRTADEWQRELRDLMLDKAEAAGHEGHNPRLWHSDAMDWPALFPIRPRIDWRYCPIFLVNDSHSFGVPADWLQYFGRLTAIEEDRAFHAQLQRLDAAARKAWARVKALLQQQITGGCDFKRWPPDGPDAWSTRVNRDVRAHLRRDRAKDRWVAYRIGHHKEMGHG
jgi:hypothetical protein